MSSATTTKAPRPTIRQRPAKRLLEAVSTVAPGLKPAAQRWFIRLGYAIVNRWMDQAQAECMNYGYAALDAQAPDAGEADGDVYGHALYAHVAGAATLKDKEALEVGCGRGGGAAFVAEHFGVARLTGLDFSHKAIEFARGHHGDPRLRFVRGDAEALPFADASFDVVLNVESSHCYPNMPRFAAEVARVLRPGGHLLFADLRLSGDVDEMRRNLVGAGLQILEEERITPNVVRSLELDSPRREEFVRRCVPKLLHPYVLSFAAASGSDVFEALSDGKLEYMRFALEKPAA
jgi:ubiquinone/menaquinone biosynthesis C-methylase UbiE